MLLCLKNGFSILKVCKYSYLITDPPTNLQLLMDSEATEGELLTITCTVESFPPSQLTLARISTLSSSQECLFQSPHDQQLNKLRYEVKATAEHAGVYTCNATNTEGSKRTQQTLVVKCK